MRVVESSPAPTTPATLASPTFVVKERGDDRGDDVKGTGMQGTSKSSFEARYSDSLRQRRLIVGDALSRASSERREKAVPDHCRSRMAACDDHPFCVLERSRSATAWNLEIEAIARTVDETYSWSSFPSVIVNWQLLAVVVRAGCTALMTGELGHTGVRYTYVDIVTLPTAEGLMCGYVRIFRAHEPLVGHSVTRY